MNLNIFYMMTDFGREELVFRIADKATVAWERKNPRPLESNAYAPWSMQQAEVYYAAESAARQVLILGE